ncbi:MAG: Asp23/Gls24 family envelope stress response protein [Gaiellaceae bacterium]|jgi:uncharacterized alkaline shock family protein YloU
MEAVQLQETALGRMLVSPRAIAQIAERSLDECYGVVGLGRGARIRRAFAFRRRYGVEVSPSEQGGIELALSIVIAYGLNLAEVAAAVRTRVSYEVERVTGLKVSQVEVRIDDVRHKD